MSKEEKAKEYAHELWKGAWESDEYSIDTLETITEDTYVHGYEAAEQDLSSQLAAHKEALRELVELAPVVIDPCVAETYFEALECRRKYIEVSRRAKTLIE